MQSFTATLPFAGRTITVRELAMSEFRSLLFDEEIAATEADAADAATNTDPVADDGRDPVTAKLADTLLAGWLRSYLAERQISLAFILAMSGVTEADLMQSRFTEIDALVNKIKSLNAPFFALLRRLNGAAEPTFAATVATQSTANPPAPEPVPPSTSASASNDPLAHSLDMAMQAHGSTAS